MTDDLKPSYSLFLPFAILAVTYLIFAGWQIEITVNGWRANSEFLKQLTSEVDKAQPSEDNINRFYRDLLELSKTDADAKTVVDRNQITQKSQE